MNNLNPTELSVLANQLASASAEVQQKDCPGNINADIPAMVLTDLASHALAQWGTEDAPEVQRDKQGENRATIRMRTRGWCLVGRA
jgi:hypothetical protein